MSVVGMSVARYRLSTFDIKAQEATTKTTERMKAPYIGELVTGLLLQALIVERIMMHTGPA